MIPRAIVKDFLSAGIENAVSEGDLSRELGVGKRVLQLMAELERREGAGIVRTKDNRYYLRNKEPPG